MPLTCLRLIHLVGFFQLPDVFITSQYHGQNAQIMMKRELISVTPYLGKSLILVQDCIFNCSPCQILYFNGL